MAVAGSKACRSGPPGGRKWSSVNAGLTDWDVAALALDPQGGLPLAVCGSVGRRLAERLAPAIRSRLVEAADGPAAGALTLIRHLVEKER